MTRINKTVASNKAASAKKIGLLIVDDSDLIREKIVALFDEMENIGPIMQAKDSAEAMDLFSAFLPDIVILDIRIPGDNGIKILEKFKKIRPEAVIIMLTNYPYEQYRKRCMELRADYFFEKSGDMNRIIEVCNRLIAFRIKLKTVKHK